MVRLWVQARAQIEQIWRFVSQRKIYQQGGQKMYRVNPICLNFRQGCYWGIGVSGQALPSEQIRHDTLLCQLRRACGIRSKIGGDAMNVTYSEKCYIMTCDCCGLMFETQRKDQLTCSTVCRVKAHRNGSLKALRKLAESLDLEPGQILQASAIDKLGLHDLAIRGEIKLNGDPRVSKAFNKLVWAIVESRAGVSHE